MKRIAIFSVLILFSLSFCKEEKSEKDPFVCVVNSPKAKGNRQIGIDINQLNEKNKEIGDQNVGVAKSLKVDFLSFNIEWNKLHPSKDTMVDTNKILEQYKKIAQGNNFKLSVTIDPVNRYGNYFPEHLKNLRINNALVIKEFKETINFLFEKIPASFIHDIIIGTELDTYSKVLESSAYLDDYAFFIGEIQMYVRNIQPHIRVGFSSSHKSLMEEPDIYEKLYENTDVLAVDLFPVNKDYTVESTSYLMASLKKLSELYPDKPIHIHQFGVQDGAENLSNENVQAEMYCAFFRAWDTYAEQIPSVSLYRLNDVSEAYSRKMLAILGVSDFYRVEFYRTLGLRTYPNMGKDKLAFRVVSNNLARRNW